MIQRILSGLLLAALLGRGAGAAADADEASVQRAPIVPGARPLLTVLLDTSAAMARSVSVRPAYDPAIDYGARLLATERCADDAVYWRRGPGPAPDCSSDARVARGTPTVERGLHCLRATQALAQRGLFVAQRQALSSPETGGRQLHDGAEDEREQDDPGHREASVCRTGR